jgi:uncharacterized protein
MNLDWDAGALAEGLRCYKDKEFFNAHEHWEGVWLGCTEPDKTFLQALIQVAAAFHHLQRRNLAGTRSLLESALKRLTSYPPDYGGIDVDPLRRCIRQWLEELERTEGVPHIPFPRIGSPGEKGRE